MAVPWESLLGGAAAIALVVVGYMLVQLTRENRGADGGAGGGEKAAAKRVPGKVYSVEELMALEGFDKMQVLSRFVHDTEGEVVGETLGLQGNLIILKQEGAYLGVPQAMVLEREGELVASPDVDWEAAAAAGAAWRDESRDEMEYDDKGMPVVE